MNIVKNQLIKVNRVTITQIVAKSQVKFIWSFNFAECV